MRKILITGGLGFIGLNLIKELLKQKEDLKIIVYDPDIIPPEQRPKSTLQLKKMLLEYVEYVPKYFFLKQPYPDVDAIVHLGAYNSIGNCLKTPRYAFKYNMDSNFSVFELARRTGAKLIYASSSSVLNTVQNPYSYSKKNLEDLAEIYWQHYLIGSIGLRFFNVFGPHQRINYKFSPVIPKWINQILSNEKVIVHQNCAREFVYIDNAIHAIMCALNVTEKKKNIIDIFGSGPIHLVDIFKTLRETINPKFANMVYQDADAKVKLMSKANKEIKNGIDYQPILTFYEGLGSTIRFYAKEFFDG